MYELKLNFKPILKQLEIYTKKEAATMLSGGYLSSVKGKGLDFDTFREYSSADDASRIDWKASMRAQKLLLREFKEERNLEVLIVIDVSSSMCYGSIEKSKAEYSAEISAAISFAILRAGDSVGTLMYSDKVASELRANSGIKQYYTILKQISNPKFYEGKFNFGSLIKYIDEKFKKGIVIILISDFIGLKPGWQEFLKVCCRKFEFIGMDVRDPLDNSIPDGVGKVVVSDPFSNEEIMFESDIVKEKYARINKDFLASLDSAFIQNGGSLLHIDTSEPFINRINEFFIERKKWK
jgi:uncharacterized protein (DUF58 family)